jgi:hypothetical protein
MKYTVYKITNKIDGKIYIGKHQTNDLNDGYMGSGKILRRAQVKHGLENFVKEILHVFDTEEEMNAKEKELVTEEFCLREDTYNLCVGGQGGFSHINRSGLNVYGTNGQSGHGLENLAIGRETRLRKLSESDEYRVWISKQTSNALIKYYESNPGNFTGKSHTEQTKQKMRKSKNIGSDNSQFGTMWITNGTENKKIKSVDIVPEGWYKGRVTK